MDEWTRKGRAEERLGGLLILFARQEERGHRGELALALIDARSVDAEEEDGVFTENPLAFLDFLFLLFPVVL